MSLGALEPANLARRRSDSLERRALLKRLWEEGVSADEIAIRTGYAHRGTVCTIASEMLLPPRHMRPWTEEENAELRRLWACGFSLFDLQDRFDRHYVTISKHAHKIGLPKRAGGQRSIRDKHRANTPELIEQRRAKFREMWDAGVPSAEIKAYFGWKDRRHAQVWARVLGFPPRPKQWAARLWTDAEDQRLRELYDAGEQFATIGLALDRTRVAITGRVAMLGLPPRKRHARVINPNRKIGDTEAVILDHDGYRSVSR